MTGMAVLHYDDLCIDPNQRRVYVNGCVVEMTTMEFNILYYLASHPGWTFGAALSVCDAGRSCCRPGKCHQQDIQDTEKTKYQYDSNCTRIWLSL